MNEILSDFLKRAEDNSSILSIEDSLSEDELFEYEVLVKAFDAIDIMYVGRDLKKINKRAKEAGAMDMLSETADTESKHSQYDGSMFG